MTIVKKIAYWLTIGITATSVLLAVPSFVFSQVRGEKEPEMTKQCEEKAKDETHWMTKNLYLSIEQYDKVKNLNLYYICLMDGLNHLSDKGLVSKKKTELSKNRDAEFKAVLSQEQYEQYKSRREVKVVLKKSPFSGEM